MNGLAAVLAATERRDEAIQILERATARLPQPGWWPPSATSTHSRG